jgi:hypothetical protein
MGHENDRLRDLPCSQRYTVLHPSRQAPSLPLCAPPLRVFQLLLVVDSEKKKVQEQKMPVLSPVQPPTAHSATPGQISLAVAISIPDPNKSLYFLSILRPLLLLKNDRNRESERKNDNLQNSPCPKRCTVLHQARRFRGSRPYTRNESVAVSPSSAGLAMSAMLTRQRVTNFETHLTPHGAQCCTKSDKSRHRLAPYLISVTSTAFCACHIQSGRRRA